MPGNPLQKTGTYLRIVGGNLVQEVPEGTPEARMREYETPSGQKGVKHEIVYSSWTGRIFDIYFKETEYGEMCSVVLEDAILSLNTANRYFTDFAQKLPQINLEKIVTLHPYDMETDTGRKAGISVQQDGVKLKNYYYDGQKNLHGFPEADKDKAEKKPKTYWKIYFAEVADFLIEQVKKMEFPKSQESKESFDDFVNSIEEPKKEDEVSVDDLPF